MFYSLVRQHGGIKSRFLLNKSITPSTSKASYHNQLGSYVAVNEPVYEYREGSAERKALDAKLKEYEEKVWEVPIVIGDKEFESNESQYQVRPHDHKHPLARFYNADKVLLNKAIEVSQKAHRHWEAVPLEKRCEIFLKVADLISNKYRMDLMAATMLGQAKTIVQAEIDCACELADFFRFNVQAALDHSKWSPISPDGCENRLHYRGMEGFWASVAPFNFTAISGNLAGAPAIMGNVVLWKPTESAVLSSYTIFKIFQEAGVPPGVVNFLPSHGSVFGGVVTSSPWLAGINFTGSSPTFMYIWKKVAENIDIYKNFPRLIGECGGKNFHLVHQSADVENVVNNTLRAAFEYSGQKCSACARLYVPESLWPKIKQRLLEELDKVKLGSPLDHDTFMSAVIDDKAFKRISSYIDYGKKNLKLITGGSCDDSVGYYIQPTILETKNPKDKIMEEEIFGPVLSVYPYRDKDYSAVLDVVNETSPYALTGAVFAEDQTSIAEAAMKLRFAAGNLYINDKSTGAVVWQQPFAGGRKSGTNDKAGGPHYVLRFASQLTIKTNFQKTTGWDYPYMQK